MWREHPRKLVRLIRDVRSSTDVSELDYRWLIGVVEQQRLFLTRGLMKAIGV